MEALEIRTNNKPRPILYGHELTEKESKEFDYLEDVNEGSFFRYKGRVYDLGEFLRVNHPSFLGWDGYISDSFFSGVLARFADDGQSVVVGMYLS